VVDSSVLLDVFTEDRRWLGWSQARLAEAAQRGALIVNAVVLAEIAPRFSRVEALQAASPRWCASRRSRPPLPSWPATPTPATGVKAVGVRRSSPTS